MKDAAQPDPLEHFLRGVPLATNHILPTAGHLIQTHLEIPS